MAAGDDAGQTAQDMMAEVTKGCMADNVKTSFDAINHVCLAMAQNFAISHGFGLRAFALAGARHEKQLVEVDLEQATARRVEGGTSLSVIMKDFAAIQADNTKAFTEAIATMKGMLNSVMQHYPPVSAAVADE